MPVNLRATHPKNFTVLLLIFTEHHVVTNSVKLAPTWVPIWLIHFKVENLVDIAVLIEVVLTQLAQGVNSKNN